MASTTVAAKPKIPLPLQSQSKSPIRSSIHELPIQMQADQYIRLGYRDSRPSLRSCYASLWYLHNEFVNIWSHLIASAFMLALLVGSFFSPVRLRNGYLFSAMDVGVVQMYLVCNGGGLLFSALFHCMNCHSERMARRCLKLDYLGIVLTITSTDITAAYFVLYDDGQLIRFYVSLISTFACLTFWAVLDPGVDGAALAVWRSLVFVSLGLLGFVPLVHAYLSPALDISEFPTGYIVGAAAMYGLGAVFYVQRIPEKHYPALFDIWGASHQIFHILVNVGQALHLWGLTKLLLQHGSC